MISLVRKSTKYLIIEVYDLMLVESYLLNNMNASKANIYSVHEKTNEDYTVLYLTDDINKPSIITEDSTLYIIPMDVDLILCRFINERQYNMIKGIKQTPRLLLFRHFGNIDKIICSMLKDYGGEVKNFREIFFNLDLTSSIIAFTQKPLSRNITIDDLHEKCLVIEHSARELYRNLRINALRYLNEGLEHKNWNEVDIRIYDIYNAYHLHYRRLIHVLENLELGLVLGESWSRDHAVMLMSVGVYSIKFFTFYDAKYIKRILLGLEISSQNKRLCDYDLYHGKKKISWIEFAMSKSDTRETVSKQCREELLKMLSPSSIEYINSIEKEIVKN